MKTPEKMDVERACWTCHHYRIIIPEAGEQGGPFCDYHGKFFPNPYGWARGDGSKKPGERVCKRWEIKIVKGI
jgi:hypothetical protein